MHQTASAARALAHTAARLRAGCPPGWRPADLPRETGTIRTPGPRFDYPIHAPRIDSRRRVGPVVGTVAVPGGPVGHGFLVKPSGSAGRRAPPAAASAS
jgi:hypothetical protein